MTTVYQAHVESHQSIMPNMEQPPDHDDPNSTPDPSVSVVILGGASFFELIAASLSCGEQTVCSSLTAYSVAAGVVSIALLIPVALVHFAEPLAPQQLHEGLPHLSLMLLAWWTPACFLLTFVAPFGTLSNGYFATVAAIAGAMQLCRAHVELVDKAFVTLRELAHEAPRERVVLMILALTSTAMWVHAAISAAMYGDSPSTKAWAIIVGVVSSVLCTFYLLLDKSPSGFSAPHDQMGFAVLLAAWWCQGIALSFVPSSFIGTINGFVCTWASVFLALYFLRITRGPRDMEPVPSAPPDEEGLGGPTTEYVSGDAPASATGMASSMTFHGGAMASGPKLMEAPRLPGPGEAKAFRHTGGAESGV